MYARATAFIFIYGIVWQLLFWGVGYRIAENDARDLEASERSESLKTHHPKQSSDGGEAASHETPQPRSMDSERDANEYGSE